MFEMFLINLAVFLLIIFVVGGCIFLEIWEANRQARKKK